MADIMIAKTDAVVTVDSVDIEVTAGTSTADSDSPIVHQHPDLWTPFPPEDQATQPVAPAPKAVRAWAKTQGLDVPARGPIPDDVAAAYLAAQE